MSSTRLVCLLGAAVLSLHGASATAHRAAFTIEEVMQAPYPVIAWWPPQWQGCRLGV